MTPPSCPAIVPADRVLWSVFDAPGVRAGCLPTGLWPLIEDDLPVDPSLIWAVGVPIDNSRVAVCAVARADLEHFIAPGIITLTPNCVPEFVPVPPDRFNFLVGEFEPASLRRARLHRHLAAAACTLLAACLIAIGLGRRTDRWHSQELAARSAADSTLASIAPTANWSRDDLTLELLQRTQHLSSELAPPADAAEALATVIARWPTHAPSKPQSISATGMAASISVIVPGDAQTFIASLKPPEGWMLDEPRLAAMDKATRLNLELRRSHGGNAR